MGILIFIVVVVVILALTFYLIDLADFIQAPFRGILKIVAILGAIVVIYHRAGFF